MIRQPPTSAGPDTGPRPPRRDDRPAAEVDHVLSFDVEEYFQVEAAAAHVSRADWPNYPSRVERSVDLILDTLAAAQASATFFVLGAVARTHASAIKRIAEAGHEIASHGMSHRMLTRMTPAELSAELRDSRAMLEDLCGTAVRGFRAPTFSITQRTGSWAIDLLAECEYAYDSSIFPVRHDRYGIPDAPRWAHWAVGPGGGRVLEIPPLTARRLGMNLPLGGGGYLRLLPAWMISRALRSATRRRQVSVIYLHPWEFDPAQPVLPMSRASRWRHRVNLGRTAGKLHRLLAAHRFGSFRELLDRLKQSASAEYRFGPSESD